MQSKVIPYYSVLSGRRSRYNMSSRRNLMVTSTAQNTLCFYLIIAPNKVLTSMFIHRLTPKKSKNVKMQKGNI